ncbi:cysteine proteinase [Gloeophyllum trabeum ATCC 11539]|uniref:ubiquitinyl hydrolase 1 n=1 Tax=Gloeophyllum trabeum (strain ATCC 11539 / FP-39264 / Madison 617) TaxID=670483 RepID=S7RVS4_GLOTA|nr:cysteine proteinase [Gloeophyllum trabeum ATCC 11539]EPQ58915.1 cysteine proteinase [Gloeophyllum trabeum ATCC 11539]
MFLESLGLSFSWNSSSASSSSASSSDRRKLKKKHVRTRADQLVANGSAKHDNDQDIAGTEDGYYPGLVNISGTYCFMNSTLQAMASLCYLQPHIERIHAKAEALDVPTPVLDALRDLLYILNTPRSHPTSIRPVDIINALSNQSRGKHNALFSSREHQDAQELFQLLSECIKKEALEVDKEGHRDRGFAGLANMPSDISRDIGKSVFDGLTANRRSCMDCGYTEAVMHFAFDNWQLALPRYASCRLEECLADYTRLEVLTDCICRKCSLIATHRRLAQEAERLTEAASHDENPSSSKKKRAREARKLESRVKAALEQGKIEEDIRGVKMEKVFSRASTKQAMIARPPPVLALHLNRSMIYGHYATKNTCRVIFPEILDLTPYTTSGNLSTTPSAPISSPPPPIPRSTTPTPATYATPRTLYRLAAVVCHYGQHSFGHYVCFRRKPRPPSAGSRRFAPPRLVCPLGCECEKCQRYGPVRDDEFPASPGRGWLRISDDSVRECGLESVLAEGSGAFMLFYERVVHPRPSVHSRSSQDTVRPDVVLGTCGVLSGRADDESLLSVGGTTAPIGPRVVRNVAAGRGKSASPSLQREPSDVKVEKAEPRKVEVRPGDLQDSCKAARDRLARAAAVAQNGEATTLEETPSFEEDSAPTIRPPDQATLKTSPTRLKAPQPVRPLSGGPLSPPRTVGLRA